MLKRSDYIILSIICLFFGIAIISQFSSSKMARKTFQPENNEIMALEIEKVAKNNENLRIQIDKLTKDYDEYLKLSNNKNELFSKFKDENSLLSSVIAETELSGQGVGIKIEGNLSTAQLVDLINALKNIGTDKLAINNQRIAINTSIKAENYSSPYYINALGNASVLESALQRKGGIIEQISQKDMKISLDKVENITIPAANQSNFIYGQIVN